MSLSFKTLYMVPGSSFILASCLIGKEAISSILLDQWSRTFRDSIKSYMILIILATLHVYAEKVEG